LTTECKEISRESGAMIFIVSASKEQNSKISEHIYRTGYHFRETIVDQARAKIGESTVSTGTKYQDIEPIPESQQEINKQADGAIRDLFPRIPNTDRQMIIEHAFKKGGLFHGEPTVGLQPNIPLSRRVQLAVLAHIRHTHTRYDRLLRETTWMNARKVVEPVCLDVLVRWRGDEETGRDQMDEILREVVIITDSEDSDDSSEEDDSSDEEGEVTSLSSGGISQTNSRNQMRPALQQAPKDSPRAALGRTPQPMAPQPQPQRGKLAQRGFKRYQAAWEQAVSRQDPRALQLDDRPSNSSVRDQRSGPSSPSNYSRPASPDRRYVGVAPGDMRRHDDQMVMHQPDHYYVPQRLPPASITDRNEVTVGPLTERPMYYQNPSQGVGIPSLSNREHRLPPLARVSPGHSLQDMLVPSVETGSSDALAASPHPMMRRDNFEQDSRSRLMVEDRRHSPSAARDVIIVEDDSPHYKRRRVQEDDSGHFRPLPFQGQRLYIAASSADSHLIPLSSVGNRNSLVPQSRMPSQSRLPSHLNPGVYRERPAESAEHSMEYRSPIYHAPSESVYFTPGSSNIRRADIRSGDNREAFYSMRYMSPPQPPRNTMGPDNIRAINDVRIEREVIPRQIDLDYSQRDGHTKQLPLPRFLTEDRAFRSREPGSDVADQTFIQKFSQSRIDHSLSRTTEEFRPVENSYPTFVSPRNSTPAQRYEDSFTRLSPSMHPGQERYLGRPA